jgi:hypothetical protein
VLQLLQRRQFLLGVLAVFGWERRVVFTGGRGGIGSGGDVEVGGGDGELEREDGEDVGVGRGVDGFEGEMLFARLNCEEEVTSVFETGGQ